MLQRLRISRSRSTGPHCRELMQVSGYQPSLGLSLRGHIRCLLLHHCSLPHHGESRLFPDIVRQFAINPNPPPLDYARFPLGSRTAGPRVSSRQIHPSPVALTLFNPTSVLSRARRRSISAKTMPKCSIARPVSLYVLEDLLAIGQHPALVLQVVGVGVAGYRHAGISEQFSAHLSLAPGSGMAA